MYVSQLLIPIVTRVVGLSGVCALSIYLIYLLLAGPTMYVSQLLTPIVT